MTIGGLHVCVLMSVSRLVFCCVVNARNCQSLWHLHEFRMVTEKFLGIAKVSMSAVFTTMGAGILIAIQLVSRLTDVFSKPVY